MRLELGRTTSGIYLGEKTSPNALPNLVLSHKDAVSCKNLNDPVYFFSLDLSHFCSIEFFDNNCNISKTGLQSWCWWVWLTLRFLGIAALFCCSSDHSLWAQEVSFRLLSKVAKLWLHIQETERCQWCTGPYCRYLTRHWLHTESQKIAVQTSNITLLYLCGAVDRADSSLQPFKPATSGWHLEEQLCLGILGHQLSSHHPFLAFWLVLGEWELPPHNSSLLSAVFKLAPAAVLRDVLGCRFICSLCKFTR